MAVNKNKVQLQETVLDSNGHPLSSTDVNPLTSSDCVIMENGMTLEDVMGNDTVIDTPTIMNEDTSFKVGIGDSETKVIDSDVAKMVIEGKTYQNILPKPTTLIMNTDEKEFKINDKIDNSIVLDDNVAEIATVKGQTYVNVVQEESASEYVAIDEELNGQSITTTGKPEGYVKNATLEGLTLVNTIQEPSGADATVLELDADIDAQYATIDNTVQGGIHGAILKGNTLVNLLNKLTINADVGQTKNWYAGSYAMGTVKSGKYILLYNVKETSETTRNTPRIRLADDTYLYHGYDDFNTTTGIKKWIFTANTDLLEFSYWVSDNTGKVVVEDFILLEYQEGMENWDIPYFEGMQSVKMPVLCTTGKNLFDKSKVKYNTTIIADNGQEEANNLYMSSDFISVKPNENYISNNMGVIFFYNENWQYIGEKNNATVPQKFTTPVNCKYIRVRCWAQYSEVEKQKEVVESEQLEEGSTATTYEPYKSSVFTISETNLIETNLIIDSEKGRYYHYESGYMATDGGSRYDSYRANIEGLMSVYVKNTHSNYTFWDANMNFISGVPYVNGLISDGSHNKDGVVNVPSNAKYMRFAYDTVENNGLPCASEVIALRKIGDVQDELDLQTGKLTQRVGEVVLDGSVNWRAEPFTAGTDQFLRFCTLESVSNCKKNAKGLCDKEKVMQFDHANEDYVRPSTNLIWIYRKDLTTTVEDLKQQLQANPYTVQYELAEPIIRQVDLSIIDQDNNSLKTIQTHPTLTHITTSSNGLTPFVSIPSQLKYPTIIKPSTTYTVQLKQTTVNSEFPLTINLGGTTMAVPSTKFTITTPETLTSQDVIFTGKNNVIGEVVITEGDTTGITYDFFEGMNDVKSPKMIAAGKNLFDYSSHPITLEKLAYTDGQQVYWTGYIGVKTYVPVKENTTYTYSNDINAGIHFGLVFYDGDKSVLSYINTFETNNSFTSFTTPKGCKFIRFAMETQTIPQWIQLEEGSTATSYEPYKGVTIEQDIDSIPLTSDMFEQGYYDYDKIIKGMSIQQIPLATDSHYIERRIYSKSLIKVKPNSRYKVVGGLYGWFLFFDKNGNNTMKRVGSLNGVITNEFTTDSNTYYVGLVLHKENNGVTITPLDIPSDLTLQEVTDEIVLRSIGDVKDTLNLTRGEYIQRIGEIVFNGSETWSLDAENGSTDFPVFVNFNPWTNGTGRIISEKFPTVNITYIGITMECIKIANGDLYVAINKDKLSSVDADEFKNYLAQNPLTIQYILKTPIIHKVNLTNTTKLPSYNSTTHYDTIVPSNSLVPNIKIPSTIDYNVAIKPSTQYTIRANTSDNLTVDLGGTVGTLSNGKVTLTTPATLTHNEVKFSGTGKVKELMVVEGNEIKDNVPFFNGMKNVEMGGIKLVNLIRNISTYNAFVSINENKTTITYTDTGYYGNVNFDSSLLKPNTLYTLYFKITQNTSTINMPCGIDIDGNAINPIVGNGGIGTFKIAFTSLDKLAQETRFVFRHSTNDSVIKVQDLMLFEGDWTHLDEIPFIESEMIIEQPIIRSQGKNLFDIKEATTEWGGATIKSNSDNTITYTPNSNNSAALEASVYFKQPVKVKTGTKYTYSMKRISGGNADFSGSINNQILLRKKDGTITSILGMSDFNTNTFNQTLTAIYSFDDTVESIVGVSPIMYGVRNLTSPIVMQFQLEEGSSATTYEPFKQHTLSSNRVIGYEEGCYYAFGGGAKVPTDTINSVMADVEGLSIAYVVGGSSNYTFWDKDDVFISGKQYLDTSLSSYDKNGFIAVPSNAKYMRFAAGGETNAQPLYKVATVTGELPLRSLPNGVCDTFNLVTGEYVQRVGEVVLDGSSDETWTDASKTSNNKYRFGILGFTKGGKNDIVATNISCDSYIITTAMNTFNENHGMSIDGNGSMFIYDNIYSSLSLDTYKQYLSQNPITVQYELETPIVRKIGLTAKGNYKEIELNGSEDWALVNSGQTTTRTLFAQYMISDKNPSNALNCIFNNKDFPTASADNLWIYYDIQGLAHNTLGHIQIRVNKNEIKNQSIDGFKQWLSQNHMKVGYLSTNSASLYSNIQKPIFFNNVNVQFMNNNVDIQPTLTLQARSMNSYVLDNIKPSTQYTSKFWHSSYTTIRVKIDNNYFNISNNTTFNSPSTLTNKLLVVAEGMQELMIIEGDVTGKQLPYYKGIRSSFDNTDEIEIYSIGRNLFDMNKLTYSTKNVNVTYRDVNKIIFNTSGAWAGLAYDMQLKPNTKYILSCIKNKTSIKQFYRLYNGSSYSSSGEGGGNTVTFTTNNTGKVRITYEDSIGNTTDNEVSNIMLEEASTATSYQPHKENSTIINMPMQLETVEVVKPISEDGALEQTNGSNCISANNSEQRFDYIPVQPNDWILIYNNSNYRPMKCCLYDINKNFIKYVFTNGQGLTIPRDCYFIRGYSVKTDTSNLNIVIQREVPIALNELPNGVKDELIINRATSSAKLIQRVGKVVLDGFSGGHDETVAQFNFRKFVIYTGLTSIKVAGQCVTSDNLPCIVDGEVRNTIRLAVDGKIVINIDGFSSINEYFNYLKQNPLTVYYELAEPVITEIRLKGYPFVYEDGSITLNTDIAPVTRTSYNVNQHQLINSQNETIIRHDKQISDLYDYIEIYLDEIYRMELFKMQLELSL